MCNLNFTSRRYFTWDYPMQNHSFRMMQLFLWFSYFESFKFSLVSHFLNSCWPA